MIGFELPADTRARATRLLLELRELDRRWQALQIQEPTQEADIQPAFLRMATLLRQRAAWANWYGLTRRELEAIQKAEGLATFGIAIGDAAERVTQRETEAATWEIKLRECAAAIGTTTPPRQGVPIAPRPAASVLGSVMQLAPWALGAWVLIEWRRSRAGGTP